MTEDQKRDRALFTPDDRAHLRGEREHLHDQSQYRAERRIATRARDGLRDLRLLHRGANTRVLKRVYDGDPVEQRQLRDDIVAGLALLYEIHEVNGWDFQETVRRAVEEAYTYGPGRDGPDGADRLDRCSVNGVHFHADLEPALGGQLNEINDRIREKMAQGEDLTDSEVRHVVLHGETGVHRRLPDYLRERVREGHRERFMQELESDQDQFGSETFGVVEESGDVDGAGESDDSE